MVPTRTKHHNYAHITCAYQGVRNVSFLKKLSSIPNEYFQNPFPEVGGKVLEKRQEWKL